MAQAKTIQLLRSSSLYASLEDAKTALQAQDFITARSDGELVLARYTHTTGEGQEATTTIKSVIGVYHKAPNLPNGSAAGVTFIEDVTSAAGSAAALQAEIDRIESNVGLSTEGAYTGYSNDPVAGTSTTLKATVDNIISYIKGLDLTEVGGTSGDVITAVSQADGKVSASKSSLTDVVMTGYAADSTQTGPIAATDTLEQAFNKLENKIAKNTVSSNDKTITINTTGATTDLSVNVDGTTVVKNSSTGVISSGLTLAKITTGLGTNVKEAYQLQNASGTQIGAQIDIYNDSALQEVYLGSSDDTINATTGVITKQSVTDPQSMNFAYRLADGTYSLTKIDVSKFLSESEFGDGLQVSGGVVTVKVGDGIEYGSEATGNKSIKVKIDSTSEKDSQSTPVDFLSVSSDGVKVSGIKDEINRKIAALDVTDTAVAGQYVSAVNETDGKVAMTRANVSEAVLNNYAKGAAPASLDIAATDTINQAFAKLEHKIADGVASLDADVTSTSGVNVQVQVVETDGKITAVNVTDNSINATDLNNKIATLDGTAIATAAVGNAYTVLTGVTETDGIISKTGEVTLAAVAKTGAAEDVSVAADATSGLAAGNVQDTLEALTTATSNGLDSVSSGNAAIAVGTKSNKNQSVSLVLDASTGDNITNGTVTDMLTITNNGLAMSNTWDCGTF